MEMFKGKYKNIIFVCFLLSLMLLFVFFFQEYKYTYFLKDISIEEKIGQRLMVSPANHQLNAKFKDLIRKNHVGNIKIYGRNYRNKEQLSDLIDECQNLSLKYNKMMPMFVATDQEGGWIAHLKKGFTVPPSAYAIGRNCGIKLVKLASRIIASELSIVGVNMNFAPVVDLAINEDNWVIGPRAFSSSPEFTIELASEFIYQHLQYDILPIIKHYPGLGSVRNDPHVTLITNKADYKSMYETDLKPFRELMRSTENGVMIGNIAVPGIVQYMQKVKKTEGFGFLAMVPGEYTHMMFYIR